MKAEDTHNPTEQEITAQTPKALKIALKFRDDIMSTGFDVERATKIIATALAAASSGHIGTMGLRANDQDDEELARKIVEGYAPELHHIVAEQLVGRITDGFAQVRAAASSNECELRIRLSDVCFRYRQAAPSLGEATKHDHSKWALLGELEKAVEQAEAINPIYG